MAFQKVQGIGADGVVGKGTLAALKAPRTPALKASSHQRPRRGRPDQAGPVRRQGRRDRADPAGQLRQRLDLPAEERPQGEGPVAGRLVQDPAPHPRGPRGRPRQALRPAVLLPRLGDPRLQQRAAVAGQPRLHPGDAPRREVPARRAAHRHVGLTCTAAATRSPPAAPPPGTDNPTGDTASDAPASPRPHRPPSVHRCQPVRLPRRNVDPRGSVDLFSRPTVPLRPEPDPR